MYLSEHVFCKNIKARLSQHFSHSIHDFNRDDHYGKEIEVFDYYDKDELLKREAYWIRTLNPECNYNGTNKTKVFKNPFKKKNEDPLEGNELYMITRGDEHHYFTSLYRAGLFIGKQRAPVEYAMLRGRDVDGWIIEIVDGSKVMWEEIDLESNK